MKVQEDYRT